MIGKGAFTNVLLGRMLCGNENIEVAIKEAYKRL